MRCEVDHKRQKERHFCAQVSCSVPLQLPVYERSVADESQVYLSLIGVTVTHDESHRVIDDSTTGSGADTARVPYP